MKKTSGIRTQLIGGIALLTIAAIGLIGVFSITLIQNNAILGKVGEAEKIARLLRATLFDASPDMDRREFDAHARNVARDAGMASVELRDGSGRVVFRQGELPADTGGLMVIKDGIRISRLGGGLFKGPGSMLYITVKAPPGAGPSRLGSAAFTLSLYDIAFYASSMRRLVAIYAVVDSVLIIGVGIYFLSAYVIRPIRRLESAASRIAGGDLGVRAAQASEGGDEIAALAAAFNTMADRLEQEINGLERMNAELVETQEELLKASTLAAVGRLAAGLAHEIGNPLGAVSGYLDLLQGGVGEEERQDILGRTEREISRVNRIVKEFLDLSRPSAKPPVEVDVNEAVRETVSFLSHHEAFGKVRVALELKEGLSPVIMDGDKLRQVFMNILLNAADAMDGEGAVTVSTDTAVAQTAQARAASRRRDDPDFTAALKERRVKECVTVSFSDTGCGIKAEDLERIFDPFFTSRRGARGTGLGLFVSQTILKSYGGSIEVESGPGRGSVFRVILERSRA